MELVTLWEEREKPELPFTMTSGHNNKVPIWTLGSGLSRDTKSAGILITDFQSRVVRNKCLLCKPPVYGVHLQQPEMTETLWQGREDITAPVSNRSRCGWGDTDVPEVEQTAEVRREVQAKDTGSGPYGRNVILWHVWSDQRDWEGWEEKRLRDTNI